MKVLKKVFESGQTILWIEAQNPVAFLRPVLDILLWAPGPTASLAQPLRFRQVRFTSSEGLLSALLFSQIKDEYDALVRTLKQRAADKHWQAAAIFPEQLLLVWQKNPGCQCLCQGTSIALTPFSGRQIVPAQSTRDEILTAVLQHL